jgi:hypothetical protein
MVSEERESPHHPTGKPVAAGLGFRTMAKTGGNHRLNAADRISDTYLQIGEHIML